MLPSEALHARLADDDPATAARLRPSDRQRVLRALEVVAATGRPLAEFQGARTAAAARRQANGAACSSRPTGPLLYERIAARFAIMLQRGALEEVAALKDRELDPALPVMRAHGVPHLIAHLEGRLSLDAAAAQSIADTRHYAKRQFTWARHQMPDFRWTDPSEAETLGREAISGWE